MRRYSTHQNVNMKILWRKMGSKLILNTPKNQRQKLKNRNRTIIWFNPPFNKVSTNIWFNTKYVPWTVNATFRTQIMTVVSLHQSREKSTLGWKKENGRKGVIIINGQQWGIPHLTETSQKSVLCLYEKLVIINNPRQ